ncbi:hypothetical protein RFI_25092 [Reticulomyxa filosa]|uniref:UDP-N-acetylglucosamine diphosphorylase n=1 Tax=Reticulomyxa filosa TaxID=46433 RepID=X6MEE4_RETFI|nr:hypothetical protein RFI_25092 [Reticulomyxa filosa]|eukprot:ETO12284.1 hypothetical protein RFI_25092 [Reticulomyxa filosa]
MADEFTWCCKNCNLRNSPSLKCRACFSAHPSKSDLTKQLRTYLERFKQEHIITYVEQLPPRQANHLINQIASIDFHEVKRLWDTLRDNSAQSDCRLEAIAQNKCGVIILGGGQGTRLGGTKPKGIIDIGLLSKKSLYQLHFERCTKVKQLASQQTKTPVLKQIYVYTYLERIHLPIYIMTSPDTYDHTHDYLLEHKYFGYNSNDIMLFNQECLPCLDLNGRILLNDKDDIAFNPNGNGGLYTSLSRCGGLKDMETRKLVYVQVFGVDNILAKIGDPYWFGHCLKEKVNVSNKTCRKSTPHEKVGVMCLRDQRPSVIEYSEISKEMAELRHNDSHHDLVYGCANLAMHCFSVAFLRSCATEYYRQMPIHKAQKAIPFVDLTANTRIVKPTSENAIKLEYFIFDTFPFAAGKMTVFNVRRNEEFSPIKTPESLPTAKKDLSSLGIEYIMAAGGVIINYLSKSQSGSENDKHLCEVSPLLSYAGEGLTGIVKGKTFQLPLLLEKGKPFHVNCIKTFLTHLQRTPDLIKHADNECSNESITNVLTLIKLITKNNSIHDVFEISRFFSEHGGNTTNKQKKEQKITSGEACTKKAAKRSTARKNCNKDESADSKEHSKSQLQQSQHQHRQRHPLRFSSAQYIEQLKKGETAKEEEKEEKEEEERPRGMKSPENARFARVVVLGTPNVGKSLLVNKILNHPVSAVSHKVNTTRHQTYGCLTINNMQLEFVDTPGVLPLSEQNADLNSNAKQRVRKYQEELQQEGWNAIYDECDVLLFVIDGNRKLQWQDLLIAKQIHILDKMLADNNKSIHKILVINKCDLVYPHDSLRKLASQFHDVCTFDCTFILSSKLNRRLPKLKGYLLSLLANPHSNKYARPWKYDSHLRTPITREHQILEIIREKIFHRIHQELAYLIELRLDRLVDAEDGSLQLFVTMTVPAHKHLSVLLSGRIMAHLCSWSERDLERTFGKKEGGSLSSLHSHVQLILIPKKKNANTQMNTCVYHNTSKYQKKKRYVIAYSLSLFVAHSVSQCLKFYNISFHMDQLPFVLQIS